MKRNKVSSTAHLAPLTHLIEFWSTKAMVAKNTGDTVAAKEADGKLNTIMALTPKEVKNMLKG